jgi:hypothetical protein
MTGNRMLRGMLGWKRECKRMEKISKPGASKTWILHLMISG